VFVVGSTAALGSWNPANAVALSSADYPIWKATVTLPTNQQFEYKLLKKDANGTVTWESGSNRSYTPTGAVTLSDTWR
jgi:alpha-amylase